MNSSLLRSLSVALGLTAAFGPVALMAQGEIRTTIPFDFTVGKKTFAAGDYTVQRVKDNLITICNRRDHSGTLTYTLPGEDVSKPGKAVLIFQRYGDSYFLSQVSDGSRSWALSKSRAEKELIAKNAAPKPAVVVSALQPK
jgi:hypothetical protein